MAHDEFQWWALACDLGMVPDGILAVAQLRATIMNAAGVAATPDDFLPSPPLTPEERAEEELARMKRAFPPRA